MARIRSSSKSLNPAEHGTNPERQAVRLFESPLGWIGFVGTESGLRVLTFGHESAFQAEEHLGLGRETICSLLESRLDWVEAAKEMLLAYAEGEPVDLKRLPRDISHRTRFEERVREQVLKIPYGQTMTYGQLAELAGSPRAARAVGSVMAQNPLPLVIPCHRVVAAGGKLGGYSSSAGLSMKERLLKLEQAGLSDEFASV